MDLLHKIFEREASRAWLLQRATELISEKLADKGVVLSQRQKNKMAKKILDEDYTDIRFSLWRFWRKDRIEIEITDQDIDIMQRSFEEWLDHLPKCIEALSDELSILILNSLKRRWPSEARQQRRELGGFHKRLKRTWKHPLSSLNMLLTVVQEFGSNMNERLRDGESVSHVVEVQTRLHARACQVGSEVAALLRTGFADGAVARWRTLHEIAVIALFISEHDESLAERYLLHEAVEMHRAAGEYQQYCDQLGCEPFSPAELQEMRDVYSSVVARFGSQFREPYGWAAEHLGKKRPKFADIERSVEIDHLRPYYRMASHNVHANPKGVLFKLGLIDQRELLLAGPSNLGLADAGQNTAVSLCQVSSALGQLDVTLDSVVLLRLMLALCHEVGESFVAVQRELQNEVA